MSDTVAELVAYVRADTSDFDRNIRNVKGGLENLSSTLISIGGAAEAAMAPMIGVLGASVMAASDNQIALTKLDAVLQSTALHVDESSRVQAHWATVTTGATKDTKSWQSSIESAQNSIGLYDAKLAAGTVTQKQHDSAVRNAQVTIGYYTDKLNGATSSTKVFVGETVKSTGAAHMARDEYINLAKSLQSVTRFSDETILRGEALLLTFTNIGRDIFPEVTRATLNMSEALGQDVKTSAIQLGKALQNPITGLTNLRRVGVQFTAEQEKSIRAFMAQNDLMSAQKIILQEVQTEFGGMAEAMGGTFSGRLEQLKNSLRDVAENIGYALLPALTSVAQFLSMVAMNIDTVDPALVQFIAGLVATVAALGAVSIALGLLLSPIGLITSGVALLGLAFATNFGGIRTTVEGVMGAIMPDIQKISDAIGGVMGIVFPGHMAAPVMRPTNVQGPGAGAVNDRNAALNGVDQRAFTENQKLNDMDFGARIALAISKAGPQITIAFEDLKKKLSKGISDALESARIWVVTIGIPGLINALIALPSQVFNFIGIVAPAIVAAAFGLLKLAFTTGVLGIANWLIQSGHPELADGLMNAFDGFSEGLANVRDTVFPIIEGIWNDLSPHFDNLLKGVREFLSSFDGVDFSGITTFLTTIGKLLGIGFVVIATVFGTAIKALLDALGTALPLIGKGLRLLVDVFNDMAKGDFLGAAGKMAGGLVLIAGGLLTIPLDTLGRTVTELLRLVGIKDIDLSHLGTDFATSVKNVVKAFQDADWAGAAADIGNTIKINLTDKVSKWLHEAFDFLKNLNFSTFAASLKPVQTVLDTALHTAQLIVSLINIALGKPPEVEVGKDAKEPGANARTGGNTSGGAIPLPPNPHPVNVAAQFPSLAPQDAGVNIGQHGGEPASYGGFRGLDSGTASPAMQQVQPDSAAITASVAQALQTSVAAGADQAAPVNIAKLSESLTTVISSAITAVNITITGMLSTPIQNDIMMASLWLNTIGRASLVTSMVGLVDSTKAAVKAASPNEIGTPFKVSMSLAIDWLNNIAKPAAAAAAKGIVSVMGGEFAKVGQPLVVAVAKALIALAHAFDLLPFGVGQGAANQIRAAAASMRASGGHVLAGNVYDVNEFGGEGFRPDVSGTIVPAHEMRRNAQAAGGQNVTIGTLILQGIQNAEEFMNEMDAIDRNRAPRISRG